MTVLPIINKLDTPFHAEWKRRTFIAVNYSIPGRNIQHEVVKLQGEDENAGQEDSKKYTRKEDL